MKNNMFRLFRRCNCRLIYRQMSATPAASELDEGVLARISNNEVEPKHHPGRAESRNFDLPKHLLEAISRTLKDTPLPSLVEESRALERYFKARHAPHSPAELSLLKAAGQRPKYVWKPVDYTEHKALLYLVGRAAADYAVLMSIFTEIRKWDPKFNPSSVFDFGSGIGTVTWATLSSWPADKIKEIFCVDSSSCMNDLAEMLLRGGVLDRGLPVQGTFFRQFLPASKQPYQLVVSAYSLLELPSAEVRLETLHNLWSRTAKYLVFVEHGTNAGFKLIDEAREFILYLTKKNSESAHIFAPCPHEEVCPRLMLESKETPCNFVVGYSELSSHNVALGHPRKERYSYVVIARGEPLRPRWPRLVRETLVKSGHAVCKLCTSHGRLQDIVFTASKHGKTLHHCARASKWGDVLPIKILSTRSQKSLDKEANSENEEDIIQDDTPPVN